MKEQRIETNYQLPRGNDDDPTLLLIVSAALVHLGIRDAPVVAICPHPLHPCPW